MSVDQDPFKDPLNLDAVDRDIRTNELKEQRKDMDMTMADGGDNHPSAEHAEFLRHMQHLESRPLSTRFAQLIEAGVVLPAPESLDDAALTAKLWEVIHALANRDVYFYRTDHLSDRQFYEQLWFDTLREEVTIMPQGSGWICHIDFISSGSKEDIQTGLRYYDTEQERQSWAKEFPNDVIPPHEDPPFDRDRLLPRAPDPGAEFEDVEGD